MLSQSPAQVTCAAVSRVNLRCRVSHRRESYADDTGEGSDECANRAFDSHCRFGQLTAEIELVAGART